MDTYHLIIYGGGNSEIAGSLEQEMNKVYAIKNKNLHIYAKTYLLVNSCLAMYKRFQSIKDDVKHVKSGGVYEYTYKGEEDGIKRQELNMGECSNPAEFENFLREGIERLECKEVILVLIGQSYGNSLFIDFFNNQPTQLTYEDMFSILYRVGKEKEVYFHLILDIPLWHSITLPYGLSQIPSVASLFIWERGSHLEVFPISKWLQESLCKGENWLKVLYKDFDGHRIDTHSVWWKLCKMKWEEYTGNPCAGTWKDFYEQYKYVVSYQGTNSKAYTKPLQAHYDVSYARDSILQEDQLIDYFKRVYEEVLMPGELEGWLTEMKNCVTYYKL